MGDGLSNSRNSPRFDTVAFDEFGNCRRRGGSGVTLHSLRCVPFFTPESLPKNRIALTRQTTVENDQPACVHVCMDLYKFSQKIIPWIESEIVRDSFLLAWEARQIDMRASPYDVKKFGLEPIPIETRNGREEYLIHQKRLSQMAEPVRQKILAAYRYLQERKSRQR